MTDKPPTLQTPTRIKLDRGFVRIRNNGTLHSNDAYWREVETVEVGEALAAPRERSA